MNAPTATGAALVVTFDLFSPRILGHERSVPFGVVLRGGSPERVSVLSGKETGSDYCFVAPLSRGQLANYIVL